MAVRALKAGAFDFMEKPFERRALLDRIGNAIEFDANQRAVQSNLEQVRSRFGTLTERERRVMAMLVEGCATKQIAYRLGRSARTVEKQRKRVMEKTVSASLADLVRGAVAIGLVGDGTVDSTRGRMADAPEFPAE